MSFCDHRGTNKILVFNIAYCFCCYQRPFSPRCFQIRDQPHRKFFHFVVGVLSSLECTWSLLNLLVNPALTPVYGIIKPPSLTTTIQLIQACLVLLYFVKYSLQNCKIKRLLYGLFVISMLKNKILHILYGMMMYIKLSICVISTNIR